MDNDPLITRKKYIIKHTTNKVMGMFTKVENRIDVNTLENVESKGLIKNQVGLVELKLSRELHVDSYTESRLTGCFIVIDEQTKNTVGAGMFV